MRIVILQPGYLPWLGFFDQMYQSDTFIIYDDVQYDKHGWRNRNRIKAAQGIQWLSVPVLTKGQEKPANREIKIDNTKNWRKKHLMSINQNYSKTPYFKDCYYDIEKIILEKTNFLFELNMRLIYYFIEKLNIKRKILFSSALSIAGEGTQRLIDISHYLKADEYLTGDSAKNYIDERLFVENNIKLIYHNYQHPIYNQRNGDFTPYLSIIDLLFNHGQNSLKILTKETKV